MSDFRKHLEKKLQDPEFAEEYEKSRTEFEVMRAVTAARTGCQMTQKELSDRTGIRQSNISRIESGNCSPTVATLQALARGMGKTLHIEFR